ncbi:MAG: hypothetical protein IJ565_04885 [Bacilli bacterium]|nr:hypothetical protein [Bacilli bacterium]
MDFMIKSNLLLKKGIISGEVKEIEEDTLLKLKDKYFNCMSLYTRIKYFQPVKGEPGQCYERSMFLLPAINNAILVRGEQKTLALEYGEGHAGHGWVEDDEWVYDPTTLLKIKKDLYYKIMGVYDVHKYTKNEYEESEVYQQIMESSIDDYKKGGKYRYDLITMVPLLTNLSKYKTVLEYKNNVDAFLEEVDYDYDTIFEEMKEEFNKKSKENINANKKR